MTNARVHHAAAVGRAHARLVLVVACASLYTSCDDRSPPPLTQPPNRTPEPAAERTEASTTPPTATPVEPDPTETLDLPLDRSIQALEWSSSGETVVAVGNDVSTWQDGSPLRRVRVDPERAHDDLDIAASGVVVRCGASALCVLGLEDLAVRRRLACPRGSEAEQPRWASTGAWIAARCVTYSESDLGTSGIVSSCVWDARSGRRIRCIAGMEALYTHPLRFSPEGGQLAIVGAEGVEVLEPPAFQPRAHIDDGPAMDTYHVVLEWNRSGSELVVATTYGIARYEPGNADPREAFEVRGRPIDGAFAPRSEELAILYAESVTIHGPDGAVLANHAEAQESGTLRWSADGSLISVEWNRGETAGFDVLTRRGLRVVLRATRAAGRGRAPVAWHPTRNLLAYATGDTVTVRSFETLPEE